MVWDETLREGTTAAPLWWFWMILALLATSVVYLILYPGFGSYAGVLRWSQGGQIAASLARHEERFGPVRTEIAARALPELQQDELAMRSASHLFNNHCSACHGAGRARPSLAVPRSARRELAMGPRRGSARANDHAGPPSRDAAVASGAQRRRRRENGGLRARARQRHASADGEMATAYRNYCSACHGADGAGMPLLGAPALNDDAWLYGGSTAAVRESISRGRTGVMPPFGERLDSAQIKLLTAWLASGAAPLPVAVAATIAEQLTWPVIARIFPFAGSGRSSPRACS